MYLNIFIDKILIHKYFTFGNKLIISDLLIIFNNKLFQYFSYLKKNQILNYIILQQLHDFCSKLKRVSNPSSNSSFLSK